MKAIVFDRFGGPEVLHEAEVPLPEPDPGQVRVRTRTAGVNPLDGKIRAGAMQAMFPVQLPSVPGVEVAGTVDALGEGVAGLAVGDEVFGWSTTGSYAEYALATTVVPKPAGLSWEQAVALPVAGETATRVLDLLDVRSGDTLLLHGATGAVGTMAVQLAVARGATVIGTASKPNQEYLASLGATPTLYGPGLVERVRELAPKGVDAVFDASGAQGVLRDSIELRGGTERIATIANAPDAAEHGVVFSAGAPSGPEGVLTDLAARAARGELRVEIAAVRPLAEAEELQRVSDTGHVRGKLVLSVD